MSFDTYKDNNEDNKGNNNPQGNSPYGGPAPQANQNPSPYGMPPAPQGSQQNPNPYGFPAPQPQQNYPFAGPSAPTGQAQPGVPGNPYSFDQAQQPAPASTGKTYLFGLTWEKNVIRNPETNGMPPASQKSVGLAYVLWFFLGWVGVHQFYLGNTSRGLLNLVLFFATAILSGILGGLPVGLIYTAYWIYEAVTLNDQTNEANQGFIRKSIL